MPHAGSDHGHAVVIGAGLSGLTMARALSERFERVSVFERDRLPEHVTHRNGVPQGRHVHVLLPAGIAALERLFPGLIGEMVADGAPTGDMDSGRFCLSGHRLAPGPIGRQGITASRPFIEAHVRRRVQALPCVTISAPHDVRGLATTTDGRRVTGVRVAARGDGPVAGTERLVSADLVVDCSGRRSPILQWLEPLGYGPPDVDELRVEVRYATRRYRLPAGALDGDRFLVVGPTPDNPRGGAAVLLEDGTWLVTLLAIGGERPPLDPHAYEAYATRLPVPDLSEALRPGEAVDDPAGFRYPANTRRRYERLEHFPEGLLVAGDAVCSFNPTYGQGMTVAAREAVILWELLGDGAPSPQRWFAATRPLVDVAWDLAIGADLSMRSVEGRRSLGTRLVNAYIRRLHAAAARDPALTSLFLRVTGLLDPPSRLVRPAAAMRVLRGNLMRLGATPAQARSGRPTRDARGTDVASQDTRAAHRVGLEGEQ